MPQMWAGPERRRARRIAGFTLLELLVVLAIIASLTAAFPLALNTFVPARRVDAAARELLADIRLAQARSVTTDAAVVLMPLAHGYELRDLGSAQAIRSRSWRESTAVLLRAVDGSRGLSELRLYPDGSSSGGQFLIKDGVRERSVTVSELTGRVRLNLPVTPGEPS
jgi:general secretion pathway protein H